MVAILLSVRKSPHPPLFKGVLQLHVFELNVLSCTGKREK